MKFFKWFHESFSNLNGSDGDKEKNSIFKFLLFWSIILLISIILCIIFNNLGGLFLYLGLYSIYDRQIGYAPNDSWRIYNEKMLTNKFSRFFNILYKLMLLAFICFCIYMFLMDHLHFRL